MLAKHSALSPVLEQLQSRGDHVQMPDPPSVVLREKHYSAIYQVSAFNGMQSKVETALSELLGVKAPVALRMTLREDLTWRALGEGVWLMTSQGQAMPPLEALRDHLSGVATVVDLSHARTVIQISGNSAVATLAKGCSLNLHDSVFQTGSCTNTRYGKLGVCVTRFEDQPGFELLVFRGFAQHLFESLFHAASEFGVTIDR